MLLEKTNPLNETDEMTADPSVEEAHLESHEHQHGRISFPVFFFAASLQIVTCFALFSVIAPGMLQTEIHMPWQILGWTFVLGIPLSLFEYLYHRYLLHSAVLPFLGAMKEAHGTHHGLTNVRASVKASDPDMLATVRSEYPINEEHQEDSMKFPLISGIGFEIFFMLFLGIPLKLMLPGQPIVTALILAVMLYYCAYEVWHAILHLPFERFWKPRMSNPLVSRTYGFHLMHHWRPTANLAVVGFWGLALWDHLFHTYHQPERMPLNQAEVSYGDQKLRKPRWPISMLDRWQGGLARSARKFERFLASIFLRRDKSRKSH